MWDLCNEFRDLGDDQEKTYDHQVAEAQSKFYCDNLTGLQAKESPSEDETSQRLWFRHHPEQEEDQGTSKEKGELYVQLIICSGDGTQENGRENFKAKARQHLRVF